MYVGKYRLNSHAYLPVGQDTFFSSWGPILVCVVGKITRKLDFLLLSLARSREKKYSEDLHPADHLRMPRSIALPMPRALRSCTCVSSLFAIEHLAWLLKMLS